MIQESDRETASSHSSHRPVDAVWLGDWLKSLHTHAEMQTRSLKRIAGVATFVAWLIVISLILTVISLVLQS